MSHYVTYVLVPDADTDIEVRVAELLMPYFAEQRVGQYRRECSCLWHSALQKAINLPEWKTQGPCFVFARDEFSKPGFELAWRRKVLELGQPNPSCDECGGSGIVFSCENPGTQCDSWDIGTGSAHVVLKDCIKGEAKNSNIVPVTELDLQKVPAPSHIVTPDGKWLSQNEFVWFFNAVVVDNNWEDTVKRVLEEHKDATLAVVDVLI